MVTDPLVDYKLDYNEDWNVKNDDVEKQNYDNTRNTLTNSRVTQNQMMKISTKIHL